MRIIRTRTIRNNQRAISFLPRKKNIKMNIDKNWKFNNISYLMAVVECATNKSFYCWQKLLPLQLNRKLAFISNLAVRNKSLTVDLKMSSTVVTQQASEQMTMQMTYVLWRIIGNTFCDSPPMYLSTFNSNR